MNNDNNTSKVSLIRCAYPPCKVQTPREPGKVHSMCPEHQAFMSSDVVRGLYGEFFAK